MELSPAEWRSGHCADFSKGDKLYYDVQLCFAMAKISNNIAEYEGLLAGLRAAISLSVQCLLIKGDSQLLVNFPNKSYTPKDDHMATYLEEVRKLEKHFKDMELMHIPWKEKNEADEIAKRASRRQAQEIGVFEDRLYKASIKQPQEAPPPSTNEQLPPPLEGGAQTMACPRESA